MASSTFLFCDRVSGERLRWLCRAIRVSRENGSLPEAPVVFLTGDALYSLVDARTRDTWRTMLDAGDAAVIADGDELALHGLHEVVPSLFPEVTVAGSPGKAPFWEALVSSLASRWPGTRSAGFLLCDGPYMSRASVYMVRFLAAVQSAGLSPELYAYLDGVHVIHNGQRPSEFENIGRAVAGISASAMRAGRDPWFAACSRCATARGYYQMNPGTGFCEPASAIDEIAIRPLKEILSRFSGSCPVVAPASGDVVPDGGDRDSLPRLLVFLTHTPYCPEWTFGGLSLAIAAATGGIPTGVVFIEDGVYALLGTHEVPGHDKVFNVQEMVLATGDIPGLTYFVHAPSLGDRGIPISPAFPDVARLQNEELAGLIWTGRDASASRLVFF